MTHPTHVAVACGGTGGHLFPGLAVAEILRDRDCEVTLLVSNKEVDQQAVRSASGMRVAALPAVALQGDDAAGFLRGLWASWRKCLELFRTSEPSVVLAMGGFTSVPAVLAGQAIGAATCLHEANAIPGRANRWLAPWADGVFTYFPEAAKRLRHSSVISVGMPVRPQFQPIEAGAARMALGLDPNEPVLLVTGGSQGAAGINQLIRQSIPLLIKRVPRMQVIHLTGANETEDFAGYYRTQQCRAVVWPFLTEMELALGAATVAVSRAGASSLAEFSAMQVPSLLIPYPSAADNHQFHNARAFTATGAARQLDQASATPEMLAKSLAQLIGDVAERERMRAALCAWHFPTAAETIANRLMEMARESGAGKSQIVPAKGNPATQSAMSLK